MSLLKKIQSHVKEYARIIASVVECEVEIVDEEMVRVAGTGIFEKEENQISEGAIYRDVLLTGKSHVIEDPSTHPLCSECRIKENCHEKLEISAPILYKNKVIGVIGLVCLTEKIKNKVLRNINSHLRFTEHISEFISGKIFEFEDAIEKKERMDILGQIMNNFDKCVLVVDYDGKIIDANDAAVRELKIGTDFRNNFRNINIIRKNEVIFGKDVFSAEIEKRKYTLVGVLLPISSFTNKEYKIFLFNNYSKTNEEISKITVAANPISIENIIGDSKSVLDLKNKIKKIADTQSTVLITGESGTGKELIARAIHSCSKRSKKPFIAINCGAIPDSLLESELFGYVKGAFSGASSEGRVGKFELANGGVIFLDEIGEMPFYLQVKLLRVLQERTIVRIGSNKLIKLDIRVIAATNMDLKQRIREKKFREDLYYRLNVIPLRVPPLRERGEDIFLIMKILMEKYNKIFNKNVHSIDNEVKEIIKNYSWSGNVRELENTVEFMINMCDEKGIITKDMIYENIIKNSISGNQNEKINSEKDAPLMTLEESEKLLIKKALSIYGSDTAGKNLCAEKLGIEIATLYRKIDKYNLN
ncbi:sigma 54-interacting transcriptional regulator [Fusobacterium sp. SB021]|uniref:sigma-54-dependent Fis family transcriptional regulator n=1 Tax=Fusobacterium sp. SB021 TaxID=2744227 RepID=UPI003CE7011C